MLIRFAFGYCGVDAIIEAAIGDHNPRSRRAFEKNGFVLARTVPTPGDSKASSSHELVLTREMWDQARSKP